MRRAAAANVVGIHVGGEAILQAENRRFSRERSRRGAWRKASICAQETVSGIRVGYCSVVFVNFGF